MSDLESDFVDEDDVDALSELEAVDSLLLDSVVFDSDVAPLLPSPDDFRA